MEQNPKQTPIHAWHMAHGANMCGFAGYDMPVWYPAGAKEEHLSVICGAGLFDTSHMAVLSVRGKDSFILLQRCFTRDMALNKEYEPVSLRNGSCMYGAFLNEKGWVMDDAIIYCIADDFYLVVVNAGQGNLIANHLKDQAGHLSIIIDNYTDQLGKIDIQGPMAGKILRASGAFEGMDIRNLAPFTFSGFFLEDLPGPRINDTRILLSRTGYTGEFGFEIIVKKEKTLALWEFLLEIGKNHNLLPCGLAARDSLRAGAVLPLSHQDIGNWLFINHPWEFALPYNRKSKEFTKDFIGKTALSEARGKSPQHFTYPFAGFDLRKVSLIKSPHVYTREGVKIGTVLTCVTDMAIGRRDDRIYSIADPMKPDGFKINGLSCGFIKTDVMLEPFERVILDDGSRKIEVEIRTDIRPNRTARMPIETMMTV